MAIVWLIRHGESEANAGLVTAEVENIKLTQKGQQQAKKVALFFSEQPSLIVTSPYLRTKQTAEPTIERFPRIPQSEWEVQEFSYLATMRRKNTTLSQRVPMAEEYWQRCDPFYSDGEGAESFAKMIERCFGLQRQISQLENKFTAIFTHEIFMRVFIWLLLTNSREISPESMQKIKIFLDIFKVPNGGIVKLQIQNSDIWMNGVVTSHLLDLVSCGSSV
ncbi:histidine phosphatase family protein [Calothrix sp. PCC 6303]|uniref:histidine phosphatase family protein n=1 Tax=Calothrix sp. PCC 6303 TaxID=1170562 RepID=UPI0002A0503F|nr:histidine phosphatase family protein [Calothrix sp. PCC 6303]AFY99318.1 Phosphoglycerate mutase [Calothrix sp. PCC 6303]